ncbi:hypothetical protein AAF712_008097 [Marasmius tenuissimus]|uniref:F-box protein n=1 Tax=Marasmius tenuissimus TaxID=585030 RepID=A0ABR2ZU93_9AGAR
MADSLHLILRLSQSAPLDVEFLFEGMGPPEDDENRAIFNAFLEPIMNEAHRWRHLRIDQWEHHTNDSATEHILLPLQDRLTSLESFALEDMGMEDSTLLSAFRGTLGDSNTTFRTLHIHTNDHDLYQLFTIPGGFPFQSIRHIYMDNSLRTSLELISLCPNLITAHFDIPALNAKENWEDLPRPGPQYADVLSDRATPHLLPYLKELTIGVTCMLWRRTLADYPFADVGCVVASIKAPALASLKLISDGLCSRDPFDYNIQTTGREDFTSGLTTLLETSNRVNELQLWHLPIRDTELIAVLEKLPRLRSLDFKEVGKVKFGFSDTDKEENHGGSSPTSDSDSDHDPYAYSEASTTDDEDDMDRVPKPNSTITTELLSWLTWNFDDSRPKINLPELRRIRLRFRDFKSLQTAFEDMFESRLSPSYSLPYICPLRSAFILCTHNGYDKYDWARMKRLQAGGLVIRLMYNWDIDSEDPPVEEEETRFCDTDWRTLGYI